MYAKKLILGWLISCHVLVSACSHVGAEPEFLTESEKRPCEPFESCLESQQPAPNASAKDLNATAVKNGERTRSLELLSSTAGKTENTQCQPWEDDCKATKKSALGTQSAPLKNAEGVVQTNANATTTAPKIASRPAGVPAVGTEYLIGPGDQVQIYVWRNPEVSTSVPVRPDGKVTTPLVEDMVAVGKTPTQLARDIEKVLGAYIRDPVVSVIVTGFGGPYSQQIRVLGQAAKPQTLAYKENMSLLDVMIAVGGLTEFAAGNKATVIRLVKEKQTQIRVRIDDLIKKGDISANMAVLPGDILIIPESWF